MCSHFKTQLIPSCIERPVVFYGVRAHESEWTWCAGGSQNEADHIVRKQKGTQGLERIWCARVSHNKGDHMVRTQKETHRSKLT